MLENKISELEKRLKELEEENISTRKTLNELIYHFMNEIVISYKYIEHHHIPRNVKKSMLKSICSPYWERFKPIIFGKDYNDKLMNEHSYEKLKFERHDILHGMIDEMTNEECDTKIKEVLKADIEQEINWMKIPHEFLEIFTRGSENLWPIFDKIREEKKLEKEKYINELVKPYIEKLAIIKKKEELAIIKKKEKLAIIKKKEAELEKLKKKL